MLCAAFFATLGTYYSGNPYIGVLCGILAGLVCAVIFGTLVFHLGSSGMVVSIAMNLGMDAFTSFLLLNIFGKRGSFMDPRLISLPVIKLPLLSKIPYLGEIFGAHNLVVYFTLLSILGAWIAMYKTPFGLRLRSVGINEKAAQTTGTNVLRYKVVFCLDYRLFCWNCGSNPAFRRYIHLHGKHVCRTWLLSSCSYHDRKRKSCNGSGI